MSLLNNPILMALLFFVQIVYKYHMGMYTGPCLQRVRLQRAPVYNEQISLHQNH